jgi:hypothetical protein
MGAGGIVSEPLNNMDKSKTKRRAGRPSGPQPRKRIDLPDGDVLVPFYSTFSEETGLNRKYLQRERKRFPVVTLAGILYVKDKAGRRVLAEPKQQQRGRRR